MEQTKILVVEDNDLNLELTTDLLKKAGYLVIQAKNGEDGIKLAQQEQPHLILMDISLPGISGIEATKILKENATTKAIPVVAVTAQVLPSFQEKALSVGCDGYITKPIDTRKFVQSIAGYILTP